MSKNAKIAVGAIIVLILLALLWFTGPLQDLLNKSGIGGTGTGTQSGSGTGSGTDSQSGSTGGDSQGAPGGAGGAGGTGGSNQLLPDVSIPPSVPTLP